MEEAAFGLPALRDRTMFVLGPPPIDALVEFVAQRTDLRFAAASVEITRRGEDAGDQQGTVDQRQLAVPDALAAAHVQEVIIKALVAGRIRAIVLRTVPEELQGVQGSRRALGTRHPASFDGNGIARQGEADDGDAARRSGSRGIGDESILGIAVIAEIRKRAALQTIEQRVIRQRDERVDFRVNRRLHWPSRHRRYPSAVVSNRTFPGASIPLCMTNQSVLRLCRHRACVQDRQADEHGPFSQDGCRFRRGVALSK
jgi:hypothetical protein